MSTARMLALGLTATACSAAASVALAADISTRKTSAADLDVEVERYALDNGLTVLLAPDPGASQVLVDIVYRAGTLHEPEKMSGLAHFVEHVLFTGTSSATDYLSLLESRGARDVGAFTSAKYMTFRTVVPPEELPVALWVHADRMGSLPTTWEEGALARHRRVVEVEFLQRAVDVPYGAVDRFIQRRMYPAPHPLRFGVLGDQKELRQADLRVVRDFVDRHVTPNNGVLVVVGAFEPAVARRWIDETLARVPSGPPAPQLAEDTPPPPRSEALAMPEVRSRRPRVTVLWRLNGLTDDAADALAVGARLIEGYMDGAFGTRIEASVESSPGGGTFRLDLVLPHDKPVDSAQAEAEAFTRYLTAADMPLIDYVATLLQVDLATLLALDSLQGRAGLLAALELERPGAALAAGAALGRHWSFKPHDIQHIAWKSLVVGPPPLIVHARPTRPLEPKLDWDERYEEEP